MPEPSNTPPAGRFRLTLLGLLLAGAAMAMSACARNQSVEDWAQAESADYIHTQQEGARWDADHATPERTRLYERTFDRIRDMNVDRALWLHQQHEGGGGGD